MAIPDLIAEERRLYMASSRTRRDWCRYVTAVEHLRRLQRDEVLRSDRRDRD
jgi:hypothetical protein